MASVGKINLSFFPSQTCGSFTEQVIIAKDFNDKDTLSVFCLIQIRVTTETTAHKHGIYYLCTEITYIFMVLQTHNTAMRSFYQTVLAAESYILASNQHGL